MARKKQLVQASEGAAFWVNNGPVCRNMKELLDALSMMSDEQFSYHVNKDKNDFVIWIAEVLKDKKCAESLKRIRTKKSVIAKVTECIKGYSV